MELRHVGTGRKIDADIEARFRIELVQTLAHIGSGYPHDRILTGIVRGRTGEQIHTQAALLHLVGLAADRLLDNMLQELLAAAASFERRTRYDFAKMLPENFGIGTDFHRLGDSRHLHDPCLQHSLSPRSYR